MPPAIRRSWSSTAGWATRRRSRSCCGSSPISSSSSLHAVDGTLDRAEAEWDRRAALGVVLAAHGYPDSPRTGDVIEGLERVTGDAHPDCKVFHAGHRAATAAVVVTGGRVLCVTALGDSVRQAQRAAYAAVARDPLRRHAVPRATSAIARSRRGTSRPQSSRGAASDERRRRPRTISSICSAHRRRARGDRRRPFRRDEWTRPEGGGGIARLIEDGEVLERGGVNFSHVTGDRLPPSATASRPGIAGRAWEAMGVSLVLHPRNPYAPTVHMNVRMFVAHARATSADDDVVVVRRRHGPDAVLRLRRGRRPLPPRLPRRAGAVRRRRACALQALVRRVLLPQAPQRAARHRRHLLRRPRRGRLRPLLRADAQRRRPFPRRVRCRSSRGARTRRTASASATSRPTAAAATSSSTWSGIAARCSACSRTAAPRRS